MTIDASRVPFWLGCVAVLGGLLCLLSCAGSSSIRHGDSLDVSRYPDDIQAAYKVFSVRCSRCHTLARPLNAGIRDPQHWVRYVQRMRLNPASGINAKNGEIILHFLLYYMQQREAERRAKNPDLDAEDAPAPESPSSIGPDAEPAPDAVAPQPPAAPEPPPTPPPPPPAGEALPSEMSL